MSEFPYLQNGDNEGAVTIKWVTACKLPGTEWRIKCQLLFSKIPPFRKHTKLSCGWGGSCRNSVLSEARQVVNYVSDLVIEISEVCREQ